MTERSRPRVARLLGIVAYLEDNGPTEFEELAEHFGVSRDQISNDIEQLWMVGRPGGLANDLIDFDFDSFESGIAAVTNTQGARQVRLAPREGVALVAALGVMVAAGAVPRAAQSALDKISAALGEESVTVLSKVDSREEITNALTAAISAGVVAHVDYVDASDNRTSRTIDPHRIVTIDGAPYIECWCHRAHDYRTLRIDRIVTAEVGQERAVTAASGNQGFALDHEYDATIRLHRRSRWALEDIPGVVIEDDGEMVTATMGVTNTGWLAGRLLTIAPALVGVEPAHLREELARQAKSVLAAHGE